MSNFDEGAMSFDGVFLPSLVLLGFVSLFLSFIYVSARIAMKRFGFTKKAVFRNMLFFFLMVLVSQLIYGAAERLDMSWFSIPWVFSVLWGLVLALIYRGVKHFGVFWPRASNEWGAICILVFLVRVIIDFFDKGMSCFGAMLGRGLKE
ncbi:hypothetical protein [Bartonella tribocorum]|uniref:hypothetical protein n=1 Tax=Bartonella tribocorum TaxID=85701 RepID=UPI0015DDD3DE|nr:hypothetical protein [Bartonella tribocorum]